MRKILFALLAIASINAHAQATKATANSIVCPVSGSSIQVLAAAASRESFIVLNTSGATVRIGFIAGTATTLLDDTNSVQLLAGQNFSDAEPSIFIGRVVCMSTTAATATVYVVETRRP